MNEPVSSQAFPRVTFGIIVLNGEPFTRYCLRSLYPFAHEIIVVEGGHEGTRVVTTADGHSTDGTIEALRRFKQEEDPQDKVRIVTNGGFWPRKEGSGHWRTLQSRAYAELATGDYLWQVDIDEFYRPEGIMKVMSTLRQDPSITGMSFKSLTFWGNPHYTVDGWPHRRGAAVYQRLFKWCSGYEYFKHEPPTVFDEQGRDLRNLKWISGEESSRLGVQLYHYSLLFPSQVRQKCLLYSHERPEYCAEMVEWANTCYFRLDHPYRVHNLYRYPSWLSRYSGPHPPEALKMMEDVKTGRTPGELRDNADVEDLLGRWWYPVGTAILMALDRPVLHWQHILRLIRRLARWLVKGPITRAAQRNVRSNP